MRLYHNCSEHGFFQMPEKVSLSIRGNIVTVKPKAGIDLRLPQGTLDTDVSYDGQRLPGLPLRRRGTGPLAGAKRPRSAKASASSMSSAPGASADAAPKPSPCAELDGDSLLPDAQLMADSLPPPEPAPEASAGASPTPSLLPSDSIAGLALASVATPCRAAAAVEEKSGFMEPTPPKVARTDASSPSVPPSWSTSSAPSGSGGLETIAYPDMPTIPGNPCELIDVADSEDEEKEPNLLVKHMEAYMVDTQSTE